MNLYEHQSTWNENMPLRGFFYFCELYDQYLKERNIKISETIRQVKLPFPRYVVFYNGTRDMPDRVELKLSDCFEKPEREEGRDAAVLQNVKNIMKYLHITAEEALKILELPEEQREKYLCILEQET